MLQIGTVTGSEVKPNRTGYNPTRLLQVQFTDPKDIQTVQLYTKNGEDYVPPKGKRVAVLFAGTAWAIGIAIDDEILPEALDGEKWIYATDPTGSAIVASVKLMNNGQVLISGLGDLGQILIDSDGTIEGTGPVGDFSLDGITGQFSVNGGNFTVDV